MTGHTYEVRVAGKLGPSAREAFADVIVDAESASTILSAQLDQPGLHALLDRVRALGLELLDIQRAPDPPAAEPGKGDIAGLPFGAATRTCSGTVPRSFTRRPAQTATPLYDGRDQLCTAISRLPEHGRDDRYGVGC